MRADLLADVYGADSEMRLRFLIIVSVISAVTLIGVDTSYGQPKWVKNARDTAAVMSFDRDAACAVVFKLFETEVSGSGSAHTKVKVAIKLLSADAETYGPLREITSPNRKIKNLKGWRLRSSGRKDVLAQDRIAYIDADASSGTYTDRKWLIATFDDLHSGDLVAYQYDIMEDEEPLAASKHYRFQNHQPVVFAQVRLKIPDDWALHQQGENLGPIEHVREDKEYVWTARRLPYRSDINYSPPWLSAARTLQVSAYPLEGNAEKGLATWADVARWASEMFDPACVPAENVIDLTHRLTGQLSAPWERIDSVVTYARDRVRYVAVELGDGGYRPRDAERVLELRYGDCKDKVTLLRSMLQVLGIESAVVLADATGAVDPEFPSVLQFDHVILALNLETLPQRTDFANCCVDDWLYFDPTVRGLPLGNLPSSLYDQYVLRLTADSCEMVRLPSLTPDRQRIVWYASAALMPDLCLQAGIRATEFNRRATATRRLVANLPPGDLEKSLTEYFAGLLPSSEISGFSFSAYDDSCVSEFSLRIPNYGKQAGEMIMMAPDFLLSTSALPKLELERETPVWLGSAGQRVFNLDLQLPSGFELSDSSYLSNDNCAISSYTAELKNLGNSLKYFVSFATNGGVLPIAQAAEAGTYLDGLRRTCGKQVVLIKK
jgi:hypothetical protein